MRLELIRDWLDMELEGAKAALDNGRGAEHSRDLLRQLEPLVSKLYVSAPTSQVDSRVVDYWSIRSHVSFDSSKMLDAYTAAIQARHFLKERGFDPERAARIERLSASAAAVNSRITEALAHANTSITVGAEAGMLAAARGKYSEMSIRAKYAPGSISNAEAFLTSRDIHVVAESHSASLACAGELLLLKAEIARVAPDPDMVLRHLAAAEDLMSYEARDRLIQRMQLAEATVRSGVVAKNAGLAKSGLLMIEELGAQLPAQRARLLDVRTTYSSAFES